MFVVRKQCFAGCLFLVISSTVSMAQAVPAEDGNDARIDDLLHKLTGEEKMNLIRGGREDPRGLSGPGRLPS
jgi:beta-glucosidase